MYKRQEEGQNHGYPGHQEIELALVRLYRVTQDKKYLEQAKYFLEDVYKRQVHLPSSK